MDTQSRIMTLIWITANIRPVDLPPKDTQIFVRYKDNSHEVATYPGDQDWYFFLDNWAKKTYYPETENRKPSILHISHWAEIPEHPFKVKPSPTGEKEK